MSYITGIDGLSPTLKSIKFTKTIAIANKESIICGWNLINEALAKNKTKFVPVDSEHFSIQNLLENTSNDKIKKIIITASGGPFLNRRITNKIKISDALKHPNWKMGKKISIDSATLMNKIFEVIEAKKIFDLHIDKFKIIIHPKSYVHAIVHFKNGLVKFLAHDTNMAVPIMNSLYMNTKNFNYNDGKLKFELLNGLNFIKPEIKKFPVVKLLSRVKNKSSYFETILITINDYLVEKYLNGDINYFALNTNLVNAQQARRVLDRLVGFELSPVLWRKVKQGLSAGRVQSVAVRLIVERENEINNFTTVSSFKVTAFFVNSEGKLVKAELSKRFQDYEHAYQFMQKCVDANFSVSSLVQKPA